MTAAGDRAARVAPQAYDPRARLLAGYREWDTASLQAELAGDVRDLRKRRPPMTAPVREHVELRVRMLREILAGRGELTGPVPLPRKGR